MSAITREPIFPLLFRRNPARARHARLFLSLLAAALAGGGGFYPFLLIAEDFRVALGAAGLVLLLCLCSTWYGLTEELCINGVRGPIRAVFSWVLRPAVVFVMLVSLPLVIYGVIKGNVAAPAALGAVVILGAIASFLDSMKQRSTVVRGTPLQTLPQIQREEARALRAAGIFLEQLDPKTPPILYPWGGVEFLPERLDTHYVILGTTGSGKTLCLRMLMKSVLAPEGGSQVPRFRAVVNDPKLDFYPILRGMGIPSEKICVLNPFDSRSWAWDIAADMEDSATAHEFAAILIPPEKNAAQPFFSDAARDLLAGVFDNYRLRAAPWTFHDAIHAMLSWHRMEAILQETPDGRDRLASYSGKDDKTQGNILATIRTKLSPYLPIARIWERTEKKLCLREWATSLDARVLLLCSDDTYSATLGPINRAMMKRIAEVVTGRREERPKDETWFFLDEARWLGELDGLQSLFGKGRSKGAHLVLGLQDIQGLQHVYGEKQAGEILGQCGNLAVLRLSNPETLKWVASLFGRIEEMGVSQQSSQNLNEGDMTWSTGRSTTLTLRERPVLLEQTMANFPLASLSNGIVGVFRGPAYSWMSQISNVPLRSYLCHLSTEASDEGICARPSSEQNFFPEPKPRDSMSSKPLKAMPDK